MGGRWPIVAVLGATLALGLLTPGWTLHSTSSVAQGGTISNCPQAGKWAIVVWQGDDTETGAALATCEQGVDSAYFIDPDSQQWLRWLPGYPEISNLLRVRDKQGLIAHGSLAAAQRIAFTSDRDGGFEIYLMNPDGSGQTRLGASGDMPAWSPDGSKIAFFTSRDPRTDGDLGGMAEIYVMNADGSSQTRLTNNLGIDDQPAWSPDGSRIAFRSDRDTHWGGEIYVMNADGTAQTRLTNDAAIDWFPSWSPDGSRIAFAHRDGPFQGEIYVMNADGSGQTRITNNTAVDSSPSWSPDGSRIAFTSGRDGNDEIYVMNADGSGQTRLTNNHASDLNPAWSPDGSRIAFGSDRDGNFEIYVMNADGSGQTNLTNDPARDQWPAWSP